MAGHSYSKDYGEAAKAAKQLPTDYLLGVLAEHERWLDSGRESPAMVAAYTNEVRSRLGAHADEAKERLHQQAIPWYDVILTR